MSQSVDDLLADARGRIRRVRASDLQGVVDRGGLVVDIRPAAQRHEEGQLDGALVIERNVLEWRLDPAGSHRIPEVDGYDQEIVVVCSAGFASSLAAASLADLGFTRAGDLDGGYLAWNAVAQPKGGQSVRPVLVTLHAHPDDEAIFTGGTIAGAVAAGWRVVLVVATDGGRGAPRSGPEADVRDRRRVETLAAARLLGIERVEFLDHGDSGYVAPDDGRPAHRASARELRSGTLAAAHLDRVAADVRGVLLEERATVLTGYDDNGIYGHIDHVCVHEIGRRAVVGTGCELVEATLDRSLLRRLRRGLVERGLTSEVWPDTLTDQLGVEATPDVVTVDVRRHLDTKMAAIAAHSSQVVEAATFMGLPAGAFHHLLATEWFRIVAPGPSASAFTHLVRGSDVGAPGSVPTLLSA